MSPQPRGQSDAPPLGPRARPSNGACPQTPRPRRRRRRRRRHWPSPTGARPLKRCAPGASCSACVGAVGGRARAWRRPRGRGAGGGRRAAGRGTRSRSAPCRQTALTGSRRRWRRWRCFWRMGRERRRGQRWFSRREARRGRGTDRPLLDDALATEEAADNEAKDDPDEETLDSEDWLVDRGEAALGELEATEVTVAVRLVALAVEEAVTTVGVPAAAVAVSVVDSSARVAVGAAGAVGETPRGAVVGEGERRPITRRRRRVDRGRPSVVGRRGSDGEAGMGRGSKGGWTSGSVRRALALPRRRRRAGCYRVSCWRRVVEGL